MARNDLSPKQKENARAFIIELVEKQFGGNRTRAAEALKLSQPSVTNLVLKKGLPGFGTIERAAELLGLQMLPMLRGERVPARTVRNFPEYEAIRGELSPRFMPEVLDAATRALDALPVAGISPGNFTDAARFAQEHMEVSRTPATGAAKRGIAAVAEIQKQPGETKKRRAKGE